MDYLAQQSLNDYQPMHLGFPDEDIMALFGEKVEDEVLMEAGAVIAAVVPVAGVTILVPKKSVSSV